MSAYFQNRYLRKDGDVENIKVYVFMILFSKLNNIGAVFHIHN